MIIVLDSSAMIAQLRGEPEGEAVNALFLQRNEEGESISLFAHSINLCEVFYHVATQQNEQAAEESLKRLFEDGVRERNDLDGPFWRQIGNNIVAARALIKPDGTRATLALGDAFGVTLANRLSADFMTKDRSEIEPLHNAGMVSAMFLR